MSSDRVLRDGERDAFLDKRTKTFHCEGQRATLGGRQLSVESDSNDTGVRPFRILANRFPRASHLAVRNHCLLQDPESTGFPRDSLEVAIRHQVLIVNGQQM